MLSGSSLHQKIVSIGKDPMAETSRLDIVQESFYHDAVGYNEEKQALTFEINETNPSANGENEGF